MSESPETTPLSAPLEDVLRWVFAQYQVIPDEPKVVILGWADDAAKIVAAKMRNADADHAARAAVPAGPENPPPEHSYVEHEFTGSGPYCWSCGKVRDGWHPAACPAPAAEPPFVRDRVRGALLVDDGAVPAADEREHEHDWQCAICGDQHPEQAADEDRERLLAEAGICPVCNNRFRDDGHSLDCPLRAGVSPSTGDAE